MGVCKYLDLSTSHLSAMGRLFLANPEKFEKQGEVVVCPKSYGWIILYWEDVYGKDIPGCLQDIFRLADKENCKIGWASAILQAPFSVRGKLFNCAILPRWRCRIVV